MRPRTTVVNVRTDLELVRTAQEEGRFVYIGRPTLRGDLVASGWGNPFVLGRDGNRASVVAAYRRWLLARPQLVRRAREELAGKVLGCWCTPLECHGNVLAEICDAEERT